jgi:hypothetical protein
MRAVGPASRLVQSRLRAVAVALLLAPLVGASGAHDVHLSFTQVTVDARRVTCRVRVFRDDLELAMARHTGVAGWKAEASVAVDSAFATYFARAFPLRADGATLVPRVTSSGGERDEAGEEVRWFVVALEAPRPVAALSLHAALFFELYGDQRNVVRVEHPDGRRHALYFAAGDGRAQVVRF